MYLASLDLVISFEADLHVASELESQLFVTDRPSGQASNSDIIFFISDGFIPVNHGVCNLHDAPDHHHHKVLQAKQKATL
jgi:hypothetical protein